MAHDSSSQSSGLASNKSVDLSHHFSAMARRRQSNSPHQEFIKLIAGNPNLVSLAGGFPDPTYFPFDSIGGRVVVPPRKPATFNPPGKTIVSPSQETVSITVSNSGLGEQGDVVGIGAALQYGTVSGFPQLVKIVKEFTQTVHRPRCEDFVTVMNVGSTDGLTKVVETFCDPGDMVLMGEYSYSNAIATVRSFGCGVVPVGMDADGIKADALRFALSSWDVEGRGYPRPRVLYDVPAGQNPTGTTMSLDRKKEIYKVCVDFDVIIIEDDPYFFMQEGEWVPRNKRTSRDSSSRSFTQDGTPAENETYLSKLVPSFVSIDYQGRVIRLDTFSKTLAPGCRLGWYTCNPSFAERLGECTETSTLQPSGLGQALVTNLLVTWGPGGYLRWLRGIAKVYSERRDFLLDRMDEAFRIVEATNDMGGIYSGAKAYLAYDLGSRPGGVGGEAAHRPLFTFVPPSSGMFAWITVHFESHPAFHNDSSKSPVVSKSKSDSDSDSEKSPEVQLFLALVKAGLVILPGNLFDTTTAPDTPLVGLQGGHHDPRKEGHYRMSFGSADPNGMTRAVEILARVLRTFFRDQIVGEGSSASTGK